MFILEKLKVIIYGLGGGGKLIESLFNYEKAEIIAYADSFSNDLYYNNKPLYNKSRLKYVEFDYIIIATVNDVISEEIVEELKQIGLEKRKLLNFYKLEKCYYLTLERKEERLLSNSNEEISGLILGLSCSYKGINPEFLEGCCYNLSTSSQDLYYSYERLEYVYNNYFDRIKNLKYVILDLYCYDYFNYDCSMTINALNFLKREGFKLSLHNIKYNKNTDIYDSLNEIYSFKELLCVSKIKYKHKINIDFENEYGFFPVKKSNYINTPENKDSMKFRVKTFSENMLLFDKILSLLYKINSQIKIYCVFLPAFRSKIIHNKSNVVKKFVFSILETFKTEYKFNILNFRYYKPIVLNKELFYDSFHLNEEGAEVFTKILNNIISMK